MDLSHVPSSTYRLQLRQGVGFREATALVPHLDRLGVGGLYLSPVSAAQPGSTHGYDVTDPTRVDPALGSMQEFLDLADAVRRRGMGLMLDIVPNHMAASLDNPWWADVLENGTASPYALWFAIDWSAGRVVLPVLPKPLAACRPRVRLTPQGFRLAVQGGASWPLSLPSCRPLVKAAARGERGPVRQRLLAAIAPDVPAAEARWRLWTLYQGPARRALDGAMRDADVPRLVRRQAYQLLPWRHGLARLRHRRFFDIADLVGLRADRPEVFEATHALPLAWAASGLVSGLRVDHIDGLRDPKGYLDRLARRAPPGTHLVVEKILGAGEGLPPWRVHGTTGYEAAVALTALFVEPDGLARLQAAFAERTGQPGFAAVLAEAKRAVLARLFQPELEALAKALRRLVVPRPRLHDAQAAIEAVTVHMGVYRTYARGRGMPPASRAHVEHATAAALREGAPAGAVARLRQVLLAPASEGERAWRLRWQQFTGAAMAKGFEDCALYRWTPLAALDEVGGDPSRALDLDAWHEANRRRQASWPGGLTASTTHDTKRSHDLRMRLAVLSEMPEAWLRLHDAWVALLPAGKGRGKTDAAERWLLLQTVVALWPGDGRPGDDLVERLQDYAVKAAREARRHTAWIDPDARHEEALRRFVEAAVRGPKPPGFQAFAHTVRRCGAASSLAALGLQLMAPGVPDVYQGSEDWSLLLVDPDNRRGPDWDRLRALVAQAVGEGDGKDGIGGIHGIDGIDGIDGNVGNAGNEAIHGIDAIGPAGLAPDAAGQDRPHVPRQGPPDAAAAHLAHQARLARLAQAWPSGGVKAHVLVRLLHLRRAMPDVFLRGEYLPLEVQGPHAANVVAFLRRHGGTHVLVVAARWLARFRGHPEGERLSPQVWRGHRVRLPADAPAHWRSLLDGAGAAAAGDGVDLEPLLRHVPLAVLVAGPMALRSGLPGEGQASAEAGPSAPGPPAGGGPSAGARAA